MVELRIPQNCRLDNFCVLSYRYVVGMSYFPSLPVTMRSGTVKAEIEPKSSEKKPRTLPTELPHPSSYVNFYNIPEKETTDFKSGGSFASRVSGELI